MEPSRVERERREREERETGSASCLVFIVASQTLFACRLANKGLPLSLVCCLLLLGVLL